MDVLAWDKRVVHEGTPDERIVFEIYVFKDPKITEPLNLPGHGSCHRIHTNNLDYRAWKIVNEYLTELPKLPLEGSMSKGFPKNCFCHLDTSQLDFDILSRNTGIEKKHLGIILGDYQTP